ncbi:MAG TPA: hypothetical protein VJN94_04810 [Candidatus Binataceae bacterium]|nr:hypothetical protein [Candidatus Binataceae bacterium]
MKRVAALLVLASIVLYGCAETPQQRAQRMEPLLSAAGFHMHPADTPRRQQELTSLTPLKVRYYFGHGKPHYWYADPYVCNCIYVGNQETFEKYEQLKLQQQNVQREQEAAEMNEDAAQQEQMDVMMWPADPFFY